MSARLGRSARAAAADLTDFARGSGLYLLQGDGHANLYQLFLERSLTLVRAGGRIGLVLPSGLATDTGAAGLRRTLFDRTHIDSLVSLENRERTFPVHRSLRILLLSATEGERTVTLPCRFGIRHSRGNRPITGERPRPRRRNTAASLLRTCRRERLAVPDIASRATSRFCIPHFARPGARRSGRLARPLRARVERHRRSPPSPSEQIRAAGHRGQAPVAVCGRRQGGSTRDRATLAATLVDPARTFARRRLAYREVASATIA